MTRQSTNIANVALSEWDQPFLDIDAATLSGLIDAASCLNIKSLLDMLCQAVADVIKGKTTEQTRQRFNINGDAP